MGRRGPKRGSARATRMEPKVVKPLNPVKIYSVMTDKGTTFVEANCVEFDEPGQITFMIEYDNDTRALMAGFKTWIEFVATEAK